MAAATAERLALADLLEDLTEDEWATPSLCRGWTVRDVATHVVSYDGADLATVAKRAVRGAGSFARINAATLAAVEPMRPSDLVARMREHARPQGFMAARGGAVALVDTLIHHQDVRRPLERPRVVDPEVLAFALPFAVTAPPLHGFWHVRGTRVVVPDLDWATGRGPEARGSGEAALMVLAGRPGVARELAGPGADRLVARLG